MEAKTFLTEDQKAEVVCAIQDAEMMTSGEIRVHIEDYCKIKVLDRASAIFDLLEMQETELRNGVLFYIAVKDHKFAILGDVGINMKVEDCCWTDINEFVLGQFQQGKFTEGLVEGIRMAGRQLQAHFPYQADDVNELPDEISFGNDVS